MIIRRATQEDALALSSLCVDVQRLHAEHYPQLFKFPETEDFALAFFSEWLGEPTVMIFIAEVGGEAGGYAVCRHLERPEIPFTFPVRFLQIEHISVRPTLQGKGTGAALMAEAESLAREMGAPPDGARVPGSSTLGRMISSRASAFRSSITASGRTPRQRMSGRANALPLMGRQEDSHGAAGAIVEGTHLLKLARWPHREL